MRKLHSSFSFIITIYIAVLHNFNVQNRMPFLVAINLFYASTQLELNTLDLIAVVQAILGSKTAILYNLNSD